MRKSRFLSIVNLKGGVGKTTVSTNLAAALGAIGKKVLLVDIDFQSTASVMAIDPATRIHFVDGPPEYRLGRSSAVALEPHPAGSDLHIVQMNDQPNVGIIQSHEYLDQVDTHWLLKFANERKTEVRFRYRENFFCPDVLQFFDFIIFDCPPRLSCSCINAIASSDYYLIPTRIESESREAIGRTKNWVERFEQSGIVSAKPLGINTNQIKYHGGKILLADQDQINEVGFIAENFNLTQFETKIPLLKDLNNLAPGSIAFENAQQGKEIFMNLAEEVLNRIEDHES